LENMMSTLNFLGRNYQAMYPEIEPQMTLPMEASLSLSLI
jgi:hypothetical protein